MSCLMISKCVIILKLFVSGNTMNTVIVFGCLFLTISYALILRENVAFRKTNDISISRSTWMVTLVIDLKPYEHFLDQAIANIKEIEALLESKQGFFKVNNFHTHFQTLENELNLLNRSHEKIVNSFSQFKLFQSRTKRSLLPFLGDALSFIAGTPSESDLQAIRDNVKTLSNNQGKIQHVVKQSLSLINMTHDKVVENRQRINKINDGMREIISSVYSIQEELQKELTENVSWKLFLNFYLQARSIINNASEMILELNFYLEELQVQLNMLSLGKVAPITITPNQLEETLGAIQDKLPESLRLPLNPKSNIWEYYRMLTCSVVFDNDQILVVISIPLIDRGNQFEIFKVYNLPIPNHELMQTKLTDDSSDKRHLVANYQLEAKAIAINQQRTRYILLADDELKRCSNPLISFCEFKSPIYPVNWSKFCIVALLTGSEKRIKQLCKAKVYTNQILPIAQYLSEGTWMVVTAEKLRFTRTCQEPNSGSNTFDINPPLAFVRLNETCAASNNHMTLPPYYKFKSQLEVTTDFSLETMMANVNFSSIQLWKPINRVLPKVNISYHYENMQSIDEIDMDNLVKEINSLKEVQVKEDSFWKFKGPLIIGLSICFVFVVFIFYKKKIIDRGIRYWIGVKGSDGIDLDDVNTLTDDIGHVTKTGRKTKRHLTQTDRRTDMAQAQTTIQPNKRHLPTMIEDEDDSDIDMTETLVETQRFIRQHDKTDCKRMKTDDKPSDDDRQPFKALYP